jgi:hypothetical protein
MHLNPQEIWQRFPSPRKNLATANEAALCGFSFADLQRTIKLRKLARRICGRPRSGTTSRRDIVEWLVIMRLESATIARPAQIRR